MCCINQYAYFKNESWPYPTSYTRNELKWITQLNVKHKTIRLPGRGVGIDYLHDLGTKKELNTHTHTHKSINNNISQSSFKISTSIHQKLPLRNWKCMTKTGEEICSTCMWQRILSRMYEELPHTNQKKKKKVKCANTWALCKRG